jgi:hypothetical protein
LYTTPKAPDKKTPEPDTYGNMSHNQTPPNRAMQVRILIPMGASGRHFFLLVENPISRITYFHSDTYFHFKNIANFTLHLINHIFF